MRSGLLRDCKAALRFVQAALSRQPALGGRQRWDREQRPQTSLWACSSPTSSGWFASHFSSLLSHFIMGLSLLAISRR